MLENYWNNGIMGYWNGGERTEMVGPGGNCWNDGRRAGMMECWNCGRMFPCGLWICYHPL